MLDGIGGTHRQITTRTDRAQIADFGCPSGRFGDIVTDMKVKYGHDVCAPGDNATAFKVATGMCYPDLFAERFGYRRFGGLHRDAVHCYIYRQWP